MVKASKIKPFLWYDGEAEEAAKFYTSIFPDSKIESVARYPDGRVLTVAFRLDGQEFVALNGGPQFKFTEAVSFVIDCEDQQEVDHYWDQLLAGGGKPSKCGWLKDKYGLSWQVVPARMGKLLTGRNANQVMQAMLKMAKLDIATLEEAAA